MVEAGPEGLKHQGGFAPGVTDPDKPDNVWRWGSSPCLCLADVPYLSNRTEEPGLRELGLLQVWLLKPAGSDAPLGQSADGLS